MRNQNTPKQPKTATGGSVQISYRELSRAYRRSTEVLETSNKKSFRIGHHPATLEAHDAFEQDSGQVDFRESIHRAETGCDSDLPLSCSLLGA
jgi:hypothetical protein